MEDNLYPISERLLGRRERESALGQRAKAIWFCGLSGSGKSTLAIALEKRLREQGRHAYVLDGDNLRSGLNRGLGFGADDRRENIRRVAEVSKLMVDAGLITLNSFITPTQELRDLAREIIGADDLMEVYVKASFETCMRRDVKGLYAKVAKGQVPNFTGKDSGFEEPTRSDLTIDTESEDEKRSIERLTEYILPLLKLPEPS